MEKNEIDELVKELISRGKVWCEYVECAECHERPIEGDYLLKAGEIYKSIQGELRRLSQEDLRARYKRFSYSCK